MKKLLYTICLLAGVVLGGLQAYSSVVDNSIYSNKGVIFRASFNGGNPLITSSSTLPLVAEGTARYETGISGQATKGTGTNSWETASRQLLAGTQNFTVLGCIKVGTQVNSTASIVNFPSAFLLDYTNSSGNFAIRYYQSDATIKNLVGMTPPRNQWGCWAFVKNGVNGSAYWNGLLNNTGTATGDGTLANPSSALLIGGRSGTSYDFVGNLDEIEIRNYAMTATEVLNWYNSVKGSVIETSVNSLTNGLILSASFNGTNPYLTNIPANPLVNSGSGNIEWESGVIGQAYKSRGYNASANLILKTTSNIDILQGSNDFTVGFWIKPEEQTIIPYRIMGWLAAGVSNNFVVYYGSGSPSVRLAYADVGSAGAAISDTYSLKIGRAEYIVAEKEGRTLRIYSNNNLVVSTTPAGTNGVVSTTTAAFYIGGNTTGQNFKGLLDEVKVYNRILTSKEKTILFNQTKGMTQGRQSTQLFAETFYNEADATTNNITLYNTPTFDSDGIKFNGVNQYAEYNSTIAYPSTGFTWAFDVKVIANDSSGRGIITGTTTAAFPSICMLNNKLLVYLQSSRYKYSALTFENGKKYRVVVTTDGTVTGTNIYIDGVLSNGVSANTGTDPSPWSSLKIGARTTFYFNGYVKNVKLYNRILTSAEAIKASKSPYFSIDK